MRIIVFANTVHTNTLTGGDRIFAECAKRWIAGGHTVRIVTNEVGAVYCRNLGVAGSAIMAWSASWSDAGGVYIAMSVKAILSALRAVPFAFRKTDIAFASSFFVPDLLPAFFLKLTNARATFAAACYLFSTEPWGRDYSGGRLKGLLFFLNEKIAFLLLKKFGGVVLTASEFDRTQFIRSQHFPARRVRALRGGVDTAFFQSVPKPRIKYDAVFVGRFHPQKCVDELIQIWKLVVEIDKKRTLALVGGGPLETKLRQLVRAHKLEKNILFLGLQDGEEKTKILKSSLLFVSASRYDSGNIALDEAMACGTPGVVYDLSRLHYPQGVMKVPVGNQTKFAKAVYALLTQEDKRKNLAQDALAFAYTLDWEKKARELLTFLKPQ
jgi:glycosyltransferase involved in cell wall biosynthesis